MKAKLALTCLATLLCLALPAAAEEPQGVYADVIQMLDAELSEDVILNWLEGDSRRVPSASAADLIGLKKAGASDALLERLLELSRQPSPPATSKAAPAAEPTPERAVPAEATPEQASVAATKDVLVSFRLAYNPPKVDFDHELWDLYVYLNGKPLAYVPPTGSILDRDEALEFRMRLEPGPHVIRVAQERHEKLRKNRWRHSARVSPQEFAFEIEPGVDAEAELVYNEGLLGMDSGGPLSFRLIQAERVTEMESVGGSPDNWAPLCEEIEANLAEGETPGRTALSDLERCVRWGDLWEDEAAPGRDQVREAMATFGYRPVPRGG